MIHNKSLYTALLLSVSVVVSQVLFAQIPVSNRVEDADFKHGKEQFQQQLYTQAIRSLGQYLATPLPLTESHSSHIPDGQRQESEYMIAVSRIKTGVTNAVTFGEQFIAGSSNAVYKQRTSFALAQYFFQKNQLADAIVYYEIAGIDNLSNTEIIDQKFELGYSYFNQQQFEKAKPLFASIKELPDGKYYNAGNYYYGLLAYNDGDFENALKSFDRIDQLEEYKDVVPYYRAEIYYFKGDYDKVLNISNRYINKKEQLFYDKELHLLTAQTYFEQKQYKQALPFFEYYYSNSDKVRKEELYEIAYTYYKLDKWPQAIDHFKQLSNLQDSLGQTSMYLLGDCYLKTGEKKSARNAFGICAGLDFNPEQKEAASFLYSKLSYDLGYDDDATRGFGNFLKQYKGSPFTAESRMLLADLLSRSNNYAGAFEVLSEMPDKNNDTWELYQKVSVGLAMQLMQQGDLHDADSFLNLSLSQPLDEDYESIAYFWKSEIAYREKRFAAAVQYANSFLSKAKNATHISQLSPQATAQHAQMNIGFAEMEQQNYALAQQAFGAAQTASGTGYNHAAQTEAILRQADALFMQKDFDKAYAMYEKSIGNGIDNPDYARLQQALILGLQNKNDQKIAKLQQIIGQRPASSAQPNAEYELAVTYLETDRNKEAIDILKRMSTDQQLNESMRGKALLKLAYAYQDEGRVNDAIGLYKKYITEYPSASDRAAAVDALRNAYITAGSPDDFVDFVKNNNLPDVNAADLDQTYYAAAENEYADNNYTKAATLFEKYLKDYPNGLSGIKATYYLAESYYQTGKKSEAMPYFEKVLEGGWNDFSESAAERASAIRLEKNDYAKAAEYFDLLRENAVEKENLERAYRGLMITSFQTGNYNQTIGYADTLMTLTDVSAMDEAKLYKAKSLFENGSYSAASELFKPLGANNASAWGTEARFYVGTILLKENKLTEAEEYTSGAIQSASGSDYWMVKTYILMSDILTAQKDYFNAKATLQSVIKNTADTDLKAAANEKLNAVKELEKQASKLSEE